MGNSSTKKETQGLSQIGISKDGKEVDLEEPQVFLQKKISPFHSVTVLWAKHMSEHYDFIVLCINNPFFEIEALNRYWMIGIEARSVEGVDIKEMILDRANKFDQLKPGEFVEKEFRRLNYGKKGGANAPKKNVRALNFRLVFAKYPKYAARESDIEQLEETLTKIFDRALETNSQKVTIQMSQSSILSFPKPIFCNTVCKVAKKTFNKISEEDDLKLKPFQIILQCYDYASIRLACKYTIKNFSDVVDDEDHSSVSPLSLLKEEFDIVKKMIQRKHTEKEEAEKRKNKLGNDDDEMNDLEDGLENLGDSDNEEDDYHRDEHPVGDDDEKRKLTASNETENA